MKNFSEHHKSMGSSEKMEALAEEMADIQKRLDVVEKTLTELGAFEKAAEKAAATAVPDDHAEPHTESPEEEETEHTKAHAHGKAHGHKKPHKHKE